MFYNGTKIGMVKFDTNCNNEIAKKSNVVNQLISIYLAFKRIDGTGIYHRRVFFP